MIYQLYYKILWINQLKIYHNKVSSYNIISLKILVNLGKLVIPLVLFIKINMLKVMEKKRCDLKKRWCPTSESGGKRVSEMEGVQKVK